MPAQSVYGFVDKLTGMWSILFVIYCCINTGFANHQNLVPSKILIQEIWSERQPTRKRICTANKVNSLWKTSHLKLNNNKKSFLKDHNKQTFLFHLLFGHSVYWFLYRIAICHFFDMKNNKAAIQFRFSINNIDFNFLP